MEREETVSQAATLSYVQDQFFDFTIYWAPCYVPGNGL